MSRRCFLRPRYLLPIFMTGVVGVAVGLAVAELSGTKLAPAKRSVASADPCEAMTAAMQLQLSFEGKTSPCPAKVQNKALPIYWLGFPTDSK